MDWCFYICIYKREIMNIMLFNWYVFYNILWQYDSVEYKLEMKL